VALSPRSFRNFRRPRRQLSPAFACILAGAVLLSTTSALAAGGPPEKPLTEACSGPIAGSAEKLCGTLNPGSSASVKYHFAYAVGNGCTGGMTAPGGEVEGQAIPVSAEVSGLLPGTEYTYCLVAVNASGEEAYGVGLRFMTESLPPSIAAESVTAITQTSASLEARLNPNEEEVTYSFEYGTAESLLGTTTAAGHLPAGADSETIAVTLADELAPATTYYYRLAAENATGLSRGPVQSFATQPVATPPPVEIPPAVPAEPLPAAFGPALVPPPAAVQLEQAPPAKAKPPTRAQKLAKALRQCRRKPKRRRIACELLAHRRLDAKTAKPARKVRRD